MFAIFLPFFVAAPFLAAGCLAFILCTVMKPLRRFALSSSLWCVACIPILFGEAAVAILLSAGWSGARYFIGNANPFGWELRLHHASWLGWTALVFAILIIMAGATLITLVHGWVTRRMTLYLFRIYATAVASGVGVLSGAAVFILYLAYGPFRMQAWMFLVPLVFAACFGVIAFYNAAQLRGRYPEFLQAVTREEFG